jgi:DNA-binding beta-propeller fold protein YncE
VTDSLFQFGGTEGAALGAVKDAPTYVPDAIQGAYDPVNEDLLALDGSLRLIRAFDLRSGDIVGTFGETDRFLNTPTAMAFNPSDGRLYVAELGGRVVMFDGSSGLLIAVFVNVGPGPISIGFSPVNGELLVAYSGSSGIRHFSSDGTDLGLLGETGTATDEPSDFAFMGDDQDNDLLIADLTGKVVRCDSDGNDCGAFSDQADDLLSAGSPTGIAVNPSAEHTSADVVLADPVGERVLACNSSGNNCETFGDTGNSFGSNYSDVFFAPTSLPTTTSTTTTTTLANN